jgi:hypothetical protein
MTAKLAYALPE